MPEHFTREDVLAAGGIVHRDGNIFFTNMDRLNAMFNAKLAEWRKQEPFGIWHQADNPDESDFYLSEDSGDISCEKCIKLYANPLPAQSVNVELIQDLLAQYWDIAYREGSEKTNLSEQANNVLSQLNAALSRAQAAQPQQKEG